MATNFLKLPGIAGDATDPKHAGWIELRSASISITGTKEKSANNDAVRLKDSHSTATVTRFKNDSSPQLQIVQRFDSIVIETVGTDARRATTLGDVTITRVQPRLVSDGTNNLWGEEIEFQFRQFKGTTSEAAPAGKTDTPAKPREGKSFLQIPEIPGDSKDTKHAGWIELRGLDALDAEPAKTAEESMGEARDPMIVPVSERQDGQLSVLKSTDSASQPLRSALMAQTKFATIKIEVITDAGTQRITLEDVVISELSEFKDQSGQRVTFSYARRSQSQPNQPVQKAALSTGPADTRGDDDGPVQVSNFRSRGPVGTGEHVVKEGECFSSIAQDTGHFWQTLWDEPANAELRNVRKDHNILLPGDRVHVPALRQKSEVGNAELRHRFRRKGQPEVLRVRVLRDGQPRGNEPYTLDVDGTKREGTTDADGNVAMPIAGNARRAKLSVGRKSDVEDYVFTLGAIDPMDELSGIQGRLNNLGFDCGPVDGKWGPHTAKAVKTYQERRHLTVSGEPDEATRKKLVDDYGC